MTNLTHISFLCICFNSLHVSSNLVLIIKRINCINTTSGICQSVSVPVSSACRKGTYRPAIWRSVWWSDNFFNINVFYEVTLWSLVELYKVLKKLSFPIFRVNLCLDYCNAAEVWKRIKWSTLVVISYCVKIITTLTQNVKFIFDRRG